MWAETAYRQQEVLSSPFFASSSAPAGAASSSVLIGLSAPPARDWNKPKGNQTKASLREPVPLNIYCTPAMPEECTCKLRIQNWGNHCPWCREHPTYQRNDCKTRWRLSVTQEENALRKWEKNMGFSDARWINPSFHDKLTFLGHGGERHFKPGKSTSKYRAGRGRHLAPTATKAVIPDIILFAFREWMHWFSKIYIMQNLPF